MRSSPVSGHTLQPSEILQGYDQDVTDEFVLPTVVEKDGAPVATIKENDSVIFFNFRPDRAREITRTFCDDKFDGFDRGERIKKHLYALQNMM